MRTVAEWVARGTGIGALLLLLWSSTRAPAPARMEMFQGDDLQPALERWTLERPAAPVHLELTRMPEPLGRDWLAALRAAGTALSWRAAAVPPLAVAAERLPDPRGRTRVAVAAPRGSHVLLGDAAGVVDSVTLAGVGASVIAATAAGVHAELGPHAAATKAADSVILRPLLVLGRAGWESRFTIAALEELGWKVEARLVVSPGAVVRQGAAAGIDTARYAAVIALDSTAAGEASQIARYVTAGGGLVLAGHAARVPALARLAPARLGPRVRPPASAAPVGLSRLDHVSLAPLGPAAVTLQEAGASVAVAAHRVGAGRVVQLGYDETWRWRMMGDDESMAAHRNWWGNIVSAAAYAPVPAAAGSEAARPGGDAPLASFVARLGPPAARRPTATGGQSSSQALEAMLFALAALAFLAEWGSRRLRGAA